MSLQNDSFPSFVSSCLNRSVKCFNSWCRGIGSNNSTSKLTSVVIDTFTSSVVVEVLATTSVVVDSITSSVAVKLLAATSTSTSIAVDSLTSSVGSLSSSVSSTRI